jgi:hypothetical protein
MADAKTLPNLEDLRSPPPTQTLPSEAVLNALKMILIGASLHEVLASLTRLIEAHSEGMLCSIFLLDQDGLRLQYGAAANLSRWPIWSAPREMLSSNEIATGSIGSTSKYCWPFAGVVPPPSVVISMSAPAADIVPPSRITAAGAHDIRVSGGSLIRWA